MKFFAQNKIGPRRLPVRWLESPEAGPLPIWRDDSNGLGSAGVSPAVFGVPPKTLRAATVYQIVSAFPQSGWPARRRPVRPGRSRSQEATASFWRRAGVRENLRGFTLLELMLVVAIIGFIAALSLPHVAGFGKANSMTAATRQFLDDVAFARQRAMASRSSVYMVFLPSEFWTNQVYVNNPFYSPQVTNLMMHQYSAYALVTLGSVGDQPGQHHPNYIRDWRTLPNGVYISPVQFNLTNTVMPVYTTNTLSGVVNTSIIYPWTYASVPFPSIFPPNVSLNLPCIVFTPQGSLSSQTNQYIALDRGTIFYPTDTNGNPLYQQPMVTENPVGNVTNNPNVIAIDWMTARASLMQNQLQ